MRLKRRGLLKGYIRVPEVSQDGRNHLHILCRGKYIDHALIKYFWSQIHLSTIVDIRLVQFYRTPKAVASYMAKYMCKEMAGRYSWSWEWVWRGFAGHWTIYKQWWWKFVHVEGKNTFQNCIIGWDMCLKGMYKPDFAHMKEMLAPQTR